MTELTTVDQPDVMRSVAAACDQLGIAKQKFYELLHAGEFSDITYPSETGQRETRKVRQSEIDAFLARRTRRAATTP